MGRAADRELDAPVRPLAAGDEPPHVVVARDGGFVTCLGAGMAPTSLPVLPWSRLQVHVGRADREKQQTTAGLMRCRAASVCGPSMSGMRTSSSTTAMAAWCWR